MRRTTVMLSSDLRHRAFRRARERRVSLGELIRESLDASLAKASRADRDPLYADDTVYKGKAPADLSVKHDRYLYDGNS